MSLLSIDWSAFAELDAMLDEIRIAPRRGGPKPSPDWSGTRLTIGHLHSDWTRDRVQGLGTQDFARLTDPFTDPRRRPRIALFWNGTRIPIAQMDRHLLARAHASVRGRFLRTESGPTLECLFEALDLDFEHPHEVDKREYALPDLEGTITGTSRHVPLSALDSLGDFEFQAFWFNRRRLGGIDSIGDRNQVRDLQGRWSGVLLFRDGFRVLPYGEDDDDWLALDRRALGSSGIPAEQGPVCGSCPHLPLTEPASYRPNQPRGLTCLP